MVVDHVRLFPLRPDVRWTYRVHEQILPSLMKRARVTVRWTVGVRRAEMMRNTGGILESGAEAKDGKRRSELLHPLRPSPFLS